MTKTDPYAGHDPRNTARFAGLVALIYGAALVALTPVGAQGDALALALGIGHGVFSVGAGLAMVRGWVTPSYALMLAGSYVAVAVVIVVQARFGETRGELLNELYLIIGLQCGATHPPRRAAGVLLAMSAGLAVHELQGGLQSTEAAGLLTHIGLWLLVALIASSLTTQLRRQRASAQSDEAHAQTLASTDALTGLGNRRRLVAELEAALAKRAPHMLALFDLDGFKAYNDSFGHPAGDALLRKLGDNLLRALEDRGTAYRMGGDEFCVLVPGCGAEASALVSAAGDALCEHGEAFTIGASLGMVVLPREAQTSEDALRDADRRMYANKASGRTSAGRQSTDVLLRVLHERDPDLGDHVEDVTRLCAEVAAELALPDDELAPLLQAAALHDIGKTAIPDDILSKPGPLTDEEWAFMREHTLMGQRIMSAAPSLARASELVRWSHERLDGTGYPDGIAGDAIPLGARIIAVCDAYEAMITDRPYRSAMPEHEAIAELRRCAGAQFDPAVVAALCRVAERAVVT